MWYDYVGMSAEEISSSFNMALADIFTALAYYHANLEELRFRWEKRSLNGNSRKKRIETNMIVFFSL